jgi:hypothetical protein
MAEFDFDAWANLARRSPVAYFRARERCINQLIDSYPPEMGARLRDFQAQIDGIRANAGSPLRATREMMGMMGDRLDALGARLLTLRRMAREMQHLHAHLVSLDALRRRPDELD